MDHPPHDLALFSLVPFRGNERATRVVSHSDNSHLVSTSTKGKKALAIGFHIRGKSSTTLATIGRGVEADIYVEESTIAKVQCSFEMNLETGVVMLYDRSHGCTTQVFGEIAKPFELGRVRKILVQNNLNTIIGMGGKGRDLIQFRLEWHQNPTQTATLTNRYNAQRYGRVENPRLARTVNEAPTDLPFRRETRPHTPTQLKMRYKIVGPPLGSGSFGTVYKAIDVDSGRLMAVKIVKRPERISDEAQQKWREVVKREVEFLRDSNHPHIASYIASQGWGEPQMLIFMGLMEGNLEKLIKDGVDPHSVPNHVCKQMLQALDYTAHKGLVHRDVKPANILYKLRAVNDYHFQLTDFGVANHAVAAISHVGTTLFMAPEMFKGTQQSSKADVWSLSVTVLWMLDIKFREGNFRTQEETWKAIASAASEGGCISNIREMAIVDTTQRASAAQMLVKRYNGEGLSSPLNKVPPLASGAPLENIADRYPDPDPMDFEMQYPVKLGK